MKKITLITILFVLIGFQGKSQLKLENYSLTDEMNSNSILSLVENSDFDLQISEYEGNEEMKKRRKKKRRKKSRRGKRGGPGMVIKMNLTNLVFMTPGLTIEKSLNDNMTVGGSLMYTYFNLSSLGIKYVGPRLYGDFRYYFAGEAPEGFFVGGYTGFAYYSLIMEDQITVNMETGEWITEDWKANILLIPIGASLGYQIITGSGLTIDFYGGIAATLASLSIETGNEESFDIGNISGLTTRVGIALGWSF